ncbi:MAG: non-ribosomal peptide synthetase, partial [Desulfobacteraceae bacterium]|nr:non-ribosomal peptide synthetase [Desulfobacteraceae bacterium]
SDGWSRNIFTREFLDAYNGYRKGTSPALTPLRIQYKDYSAWQNSQLESADIENQKKYWLEKLTGGIPVLDLPADKIRPSVQTYHGNTFGFSLSKEINYGLNNLCRENQISLFMVLQALLKVLFHRYTGQNDIIIGSPVAGRVHRDLEDQIGFYVNTLVFRDTIESDSMFREILNDVKQTCTDAFDNQDYPFDRLVEDLDVKRDLSRSPLFDVMLTLHNNENDAVEFEGLEVSLYKTESFVSKYDMSFDILESETGLNINIQYNTDIYSEERMSRMSGHFKTLVKSVLDNPESRIKDLDILPQEEKDRLLIDFNDTAKDFPEDKTFIHIFQEQVEKTPDNIAVV